VSGKAKGDQRTGNQDLTHRHSPFQGSLTGAASAVTAAVSYAMASKAVSLSICASLTAAPSIFMLLVKQY
jgi:hypothetical protein